MSLNGVVNIEDLHQLAKKRLPKIAFDFIEGGLDDEIGIERNTWGFERHRIVPRYMVDVSKRTQTTELFGRTYSQPVGIAPTGGAALFRPGADLMLAAAARKANVPFIMSGASTDTIEVLPTDRKTLEFSYADRDAYAFMDPNSFEQIELTEAQLGEVKNYLAPGGKVDVLFVDERPLSVDLPSTVALKVVESADGVKGDTASNVQKPAKLETGLIVQVPLFIKEGETIRVSTVDGSYLGRV